MENKEEPKVIEWTLEDDVLNELKRISLVSEPAIEENFMLFNAADIQFKTVDKEKRVVSGPAMRANIHIPRYDEDGTLYYGYFSESTVRKAAEIFFKKGSIVNNTNIEHEIEIDGVYLFESWIVENPEMDKAVDLGFKNIKPGDWFVSMKIDNEDVWDKYLKTGMIKGFSVEIKADEKEVQILESIKDILFRNSDEIEAFEEIKKTIKQYEG